MSDTELSEAIGAIRLNQTHPIRINLYSSILAKFDAVSDSLRIKVELLRRLRDAGEPISFTVFVHASDYEFPELRIVPSVTQMLHAPEFWDADLHVFEAGAYYELFDAIHLIPDAQKKLVIHHNTTPPDLVDLPQVKAGCEQAILQLTNVDLADHVATVGEFTRDELRSEGFVSTEKISVLHLPPEHFSPVSVETRFAGEGEGKQVNLVFVGRFVRAKGVLDLLDAFDLLVARGIQGMSLVVAGNARFSDEAIMARLSEHAERSHGDNKFTMLISPSGTAVEALFENADALVIPSYHEGYCVPAVEALTAGAFVIGLRAGNLPYVTGGLGRLVEPGHPEQLADAIGEFVTELHSARSKPNQEVVLHTDRGPLTETKWRAAVRAHLEDYSRESFERGFLDLVRRLTSAGEASSHQAA